MIRNTMSFKAIINNIAKENKISAQSVLQTYMLERILERISVSKYKDNFILKGGMLISAMLGIDSRTTMDMDTTIKGFNLTEENINNIMNEICDIELQDNVTIEVKNISPIRENDDYGGYRITFEANLNNEMPVITKIDITTGDKITYREVKYDFSLIGILAKISTILAQAKISIFAISTYNTDYILLKSEKLEKTIEVLKQNGYIYIRRNL